MKNSNDDIKKELHRLRFYIEFIRSKPKLEKLLRKITSKHPWYDISSIIWVFSFAAVIFIGFQHFFVVSVNLLAAVLLRSIIQSKQPVEYDRKFKPSTNISESSYGLPSIESYMSVIIFLNISYHYKSILVVLLGSVVTIIIGLSRLYSRCRFPFQIINSWVFGVLGFIITEIIYIQFKINKFVIIEIYI